MILAFLQNQWFRQPERVRAMYDERPDLRNEYIRHFLFMGCLTGKRLSAAFGEDICHEHIIWEEVSPEIGGAASSKFPADFEHIGTAIYKYKPRIIVALGKSASDALEGMLGMERPPIRLICGPHPAARNNPMPRLREIGDELRTLIGAV
jgi:hypothetical protein